MKPSVLIPLLLVCAACANVPELEGREGPSVRNARYPRLIPLDETLGAPVNPANEAEDVESDLIARSEELARKAAALQSAKIN
jgi:hypothetical protein